MSDRYMIISSDCHAGLPDEEYRSYLDPQYREAFDAFLAAAEFYGSDVDGLRPLADRIGPTPDDLGQTTPEAAAARGKWTELRDAGRPWVTRVEAIPVGTRTTRVF